MEIHQFTRSMRHATCARLGVRPSAMLVALSIDRLLKKAQQPTAGSNESRMGLDKDHDNTTPQIGTPSTLPLE